MRYDKIFSDCKKGQAAMEFLMTYGWALVVVFVSIAGLMYFGANKPEQFLPEKCMIPTSSGLFCNDFTGSTTGFTIRIKNILSDDVTVDSVVLSGCGSDTDTAVIPSSGGTADFEISCAVPVGKFKGDLVVNYKEGADGLSKSVSGSIMKNIV